MLIPSKIAKFVLKYHGLLQTAWQTKPLKCDNTAFAIYQCVLTLSCIQQGKCVKGGDGCSQPAG